MDKYLFPEDRDLSVQERYTLYEYIMQSYTNDHSKITSLEGLKNPTLKERRDAFLGEIRKTGALTHSSGDMDTLATREAMEIRMMDRLKLGHEDARNLRRTYLQGAHNAKPTHFSYNDDVIDQNYMNLVEKGYDKKSKTLTLGDLQFDTKLGVWTGQIKNQPENLKDAKFVYVNSEFMAGKESEIRYVLDENGKVTSKPNFKTTMEVGYPKNLDLNTPTSEFDCDLKNAFYNNYKEDKNFSKNFITSKGYKDVSDFQLKNSLEQTGTLDRQTFDKMHDVTDRENTKQYKIAENKRFYDIAAEEVLHKTLPGVGKIKRDKPHIDTKFDEIDFKNLFKNKISGGETVKENDSPRSTRSEKKHNENLEIK